MCVMHGIESCKGHDRMRVQCALSSGSWWKTRRESDVASHFFRIGFRASNSRVYIKQQQKMYYIETYVYYNSSPYDARCIPRLSSNSYPYSSWYRYLENLDLHRVRHGRLRNFDSEDAILELGTDACSIDLLGEVDSPREGEAAEGTGVGGGRCHGLVIGDSCP
jgi:hypothetical protein